MRCTDVPVFEVGVRIHLFPTVFVLWLSGCQFDGSLPDGAVFSCIIDGGGGDCPPGLVCGQESFCVVPVARNEVTVEDVRTQYELAPSNPRTTATVARVDTRVELEVLFNQRVQCVGLAAAPELIFFAPLNAEGGACRFSGTPRPTLVGDQTCALTVTVRDSRGDVFVLPLAPSVPVRIDTTPPAAALEGDGGLQYRRAPLGVAVVPSGPSNRVTGVAGSVEPGLLIRVLDPRAELARGTASSEGSFAIDLPPDPLRVAVTTVDLAGNESTPTLVRDVTLVATHQGRQAMGQTGNPHRLFVRHAQSASRFEPLEEDEVSGDAGIDVRDGQRLEVTGGIGRWRQADVFPTQSKLWTAFDTRRGRLIAAGPDGTYAYDGTNWSRLGVGPPEFGPIAYDEFRDRVVGFRVATFEFNGSQWQTLTTAGPAERSEGTLVYDRRRRLIVLVGGGRTESFPPTFTPVYRATPDAWSFDGVRWRRLGPASGEPSGTGVYDDLRGEIISFMGSSGSTLSWTPEGSVVRADAGPGRRENHCMTWDATRNRVLLIGGQAPSSGFLRPPFMYDDVWSWDGTSWSLETADAGLGGIVLPDGGVTSLETTCGFDRARDAVVVAGGGIGRNSTRLYDRGSFREVVQTSAPRPPPGQVAAIDGGLLHVRGTTHRWVNGAWLALNDSAPEFSSLAVSPAETVVGLTTNEAWGFTGSSWSPVSDGGPSGVGSPLLFFDVDAGRFVAHRTNSALALVAGEWLPQPTTPYSFSRGQPLAIAFSPLHGAPVRVGSAGTELWTGAGWLDLDAGVSVGASQNNDRLVTDWVGQQLFMVSGGPVKLQRLTRSGWEQVPQLNASPRWTMGHELAATFANRRLWVSSGLRLSQTDGLTTEFALSELRPAIIAHYQLPPLDGVTITSIEVTAIAGGSSGARLRLWEHFQWRDPSATAVNSNSNQQPGPVTLTVTDPGLVTSLLSDSQLSVAIESVGDNGPGAAVISADALELRIHYRLP